MNEIDLKKTIAKNLAFYRKLRGWTQLELAERINYSDKSVSKWERAEGLPDVVVLTTLAELFGVTVNDLLSVEEPVTPAPEKQTHSLRTRIAVLLLSIGLVWLVAATVFFVLGVAAPDYEHAAFAFIIALPVSAIVAVVFCCMWWGWLIKCISVSVLVWLCALCMNIFLVNDKSVMIYVVAAVLQILIALWYFLLEKPKERERIRDREKAIEDEKKAEQ